MRQKVNGYDSTMAPDSKRFCSHHQEYVLVTGGSYVVFNNGLNRRWVCAACVAKQNKRAEEKTK